jgi:cysteine-rich repeat protein
MHKRIASLLSALFFFACGDPPEVCNDNADNDGDGLVDCFDEDDCSQSAVCQPRCGNNIIDAGEQCDDGNLLNGDGCSNLCQLEGNPVCGNGAIEAPEECDGANLDNLDCSDFNFDVGALACDNQCTFDISDCRDAICGDGVQEGPEQCDDGNTGDLDGCSAACTIEDNCGNGSVELNEQCDGNNLSGQDCTDFGFDAGTLACNANCLFILGGCTEALCGDGVLEGSEQCDDNNILDGDGCSSDCIAGLGFLCLGAPSQCDTVCGDGLIRGEEVCDDDNTNNNDGCDNLCQNEEPFICEGEPSACRFPVFLKVESNGGHSCALLGNGNIRCWGLNNLGQLGYGDTNDIGDDELPSSASDIVLGGFAVDMSVGGAHTCALLDTGNIRCWGSNSLGQLGYGNINNIGDNEDPAVAGNVNVGGAVVEVVAGGNHTCALLSNGSVKCWGRNNFGQLGLGNTLDVGDDELPSAAANVNVGGTVVQIAGGGQHTCALLDTGNVRCWGRSNFGQLGYGNINTIGDNETPASAGDVNIGGTVVQISAAANHTCALLNTGNVRCWGQSSSGQVGYGNTLTIGDDETPNSVGDVNVGGVVTKVDAGDFHTCVILDSDNVKCWGFAGNGRLGYGNANNIGDNEAPAAVGFVSLGGPVAQLSAGGCAPALC